MTALVVAGGVAANKVIRHQLEQLVLPYNIPFVAPPLELCTDNGVMVAWAGLERYRLGFVDGLDTAARPRWPLESLSLGPAASTVSARGDYKEVNVKK